jgi:hypothetical protein
MTILFAQKGIAEKLGRTKFGQILGNCPPTGKFSVAIPSLGLKKMPAQGQCPTESNVWEVWRRPLFAGTGPVRHLQWHDPGRH